MITEGVRAPARSLAKAKPAKIGGFFVLVGWRACSSGPKKQKMPQQEVGAVLLLQLGTARSNERSEVNPSQVTNNSKTHHKGGF